MIVIDSSALIAVVKREPGKARVVDALSQSLVSAVVLVETLSKLRLLGYDSEEAYTGFIAAGLSVQIFDESQMPAVLSLAALADRGISLADRVCLGLALDRNLPVLTGDRAWIALGLPLDIQLFR